MDTNKVIKKKGTAREKERELLDELMNQLENEKPVEEESKPIEITEQVKEKMSLLMDAYLSNKIKLAKVQEIRKNLVGYSNTYMKELETLMKLYGLTELIKGSNKFVLNRTMKKKPLKKSEFREVMSIVLGDPEKVEKIYETVGQMSEEVVVEKLKCLKYRGNTGSS